MTRQTRVISAGTSFPNTPESDLQPTVMHDVRVVLPSGEGTVVRVMAEDPGFAIDSINRMTDEAIEKLPRAPESDEDSEPTRKLRPR